MDWYTLIYAITALNLLPQFLRGVESEGHFIPLVPPGLAKLDLRTSFSCLPASHGVFCLDLLSRSYFLPCFVVAGFKGVTVKGHVLKDKCPFSCCHLHNDGSSFRFGCNFLALFGFTFLGLYIHPGSYMGCSSHTTSGDALKLVPSALQKPQSKNIHEIPLLNL